MRKASPNTKGFALVELLIVVAVLVAVGAIGFYAYHRSHKTKTVASDTASHQSSTNQNTQTPPADPYSGWSKGTLASSGLTFKYPANWTVEDTAECDGAHSYTLDAPSSEVQQSGLTGASHYGLAITVNAEATGTSKCAPSVASRVGVVLGSQSHSDQVSGGALKGKYVVVNGGSDGTSGIDVFNAAYSSEQKITETGLVSGSGVNLQITSSFSSGQNPTNVAVEGFLGSQLYKDTLNIVNSLAGN